MINSQDIKKGTCIRLDGKLYFCVDFLHVKPGKGNTIMRTTLKDVVKGGQIERRFNIGEKLEDVRVERRPYQYTYAEGEHYHFMNQETFDDVIIDKDLITYTEPGVKGDTATNTLKPATVESGAEVRVPLFINEGEIIEINTTDGSYVGRIRE